MIHEGEFWQLFYRNGEPIPGVGRDVTLDNPRSGDEIIGVTVVFLYRVRNGKPEFLWQKRSDKVTAYPGEYDFSAGGHVNLGESLTEAAVREAHEEIGAEITAEDLCFVTMCGHGTNRFGWVYVVDWTEREDDFNFDDGEVSEVKWVPYAEMEVFREKYAKEPLKKDDFTFLAIKKWLELREMI